MKIIDKNHIPFTKMQGAGNDFVVIDNRSKDLKKEDIIEITPEICNRKFGVGSDGILVLMPPEKAETDYTMFYRNPDGSDAGMCGNGARCIALFAYSLGFESAHTFSVHDEIYKAEITGSDSVKISFPMEAKAESLNVNDTHCYSIHTGTEHIVIPSDEDHLENEEELRNQGRKLRYHDKFTPKGTNVNFISGIDATHLKLQTYERGVEDLTLACGTGAIASALIWHHIQDEKTESSVYSVDTKGGTLEIHFSWNQDTQTYSNINLEGPANFVFRGQYFA